MDSSVSMKTLSGNLIRNDKSYLYIAILFMTFYTAPLFSYSPVRFSDIGALILLYLSLKAGRKISLNLSNGMFICFGVWAISDFFIIPFFFDDFNACNHLFQLFRLEIAILVFLLFPNILRNISFETIICVLKKVILTHAIIQILYVIFYYAGVHFFHFINTFDERLSLISENHLFFNHFIILNIETEQPRFSGLFEEPAWFGWTMSLMLSIVLQACLHFKRGFFTSKEWIAIIASYAFTFSLSAIFQLMAICGIYASYRYRKHFGKLMLLLSILISCLLLYLMINPSIVNRLILITEGGDGSTSSRVIGSWNALVTTLHIQPWIGFGLGDTNASLFFDYAKSNNLHEGVFIRDIYVIGLHNIIAQVICSLGIIGSFFFLYPFIHFFNKHSIIVAIALFFVFMSVNVYNTFFFFTMCSLAFHSFGNRRLIRQSLS
jgi:membrane protein